MTQVPRHRGTKGSLRWIQLLVNEKPEILNAKLRPLIGLASDADIEWMSPIASDDYAEYRDDKALEMVGLEPQVRPLGDFWPKRGPQWDALAKFKNGGAVFVEAKAHVSELFSGGTAAGDESRKIIEAALAEAREFYKARSGCDWSERFYQYANRLAHIYFLREVNRLEAYLAFVYFLNDPDLDGPHSEREWRAAIDVLHEALGMTGRLPRKYVLDVFVDVGELE